MLNSSLKAAALIFLSVASVNPALAQVDIGAGYQYGGALGAKYSLVQGEHTVYASLGLIGAAMGYQFVFSNNNKHAIGIAVGSEVITSEKGFAAFTYNYYSQGVSASGWVLGGSVGARREDKASMFASLDEVHTKTLVGIHVGYRF
ncbi:hypothetical protein PSECIP111854_01455 [Pseudoalteromonas sp. CIP111854]|uniref:Outer membrane protein beta-barrel domain-containing protein n=1 Tax=Pseudoalteromonas holothuriae TaxID=2963714 RepID=A0A9W4VP46_9GAMM|nr:hypothetical protein [Pseudoalteromonas sp. CIP111854]CAH9054834.1 hypothetical protein PSECIP111854_01455 [Pseudoalteromonas sp. CIP111854]